MTLVLDRAEVPAPATPELSTGSFGLSVTIGNTGSFGFLVDPSGGASPADQFRNSRHRLPGYYDWLRVPSEPALTLVDELMPEHPEFLPRQPFVLLVAPQWTAFGQTVEVLVNSAFRAHNEILVRVPAWAKQLTLDQPIERWIALQPHLAQLGSVGLVGVETTSAGERALQVFVRADELTAADLKRLAAVAGAPAGELLHFWRSLCLSSADEPGSTLVSLRLSGRESLDVGVSFPARRAGSSIEIQKRLQCLARAHELDTGRYLESILELSHTTGREPEHTMLGFASRNGELTLTASFEATPCEGRMPSQGEWRELETIDSRAS